MQRELVVKARDEDMDAYSDLVQLAHPRLSRSWLNGTRLSLAAPGDTGWR